MNGRVVLTGGSSFVGMHLGLALAEAGWAVTAVHSRPLEADLRGQRLQRLAPVARLVEADLTDPGAAARLVEEAQPTLWIQHAGWAVGYASPDYDLALGHRLNSDILTPLYRALAGRGCGVIVTGSSAEYAASDDALAEDSLCLPDTPYGLSKLSATIRARQLAVRYGVPTRVARLFIPFGRFDNPAKVLPQVVEALTLRRAVDLSEGLQRRDFCGVSDIARGYLALSGDFARTGFDIFNLASGVPTTLRDLLLQIAEQIGADPGLLRFGAVPMRSGETPHCIADVGKAERLLGWRASDLSVAIDRDLLNG